MPTGFKRTHDEAKAIMLKAGLEPLEPYINSTTKWKTKCLKCSDIIYPMSQSVKAGHGCRNCAYKNQVVSENKEKQVGSKKKGAKPIKHEIAEAIMLKANLQPLELYVKIFTNGSVNALNVERLFIHDIATYAMVRVVVELVEM